MENDRINDCVIVTVIARNMGWYPPQPEIQWENIGAEVCALNCRTINHISCIDEPCHSWYLSSALQNLLFPTRYWGEQKMNMDDDDSMLMLSMRGIICLQSLLGVDSSR